MDLVIGGPFQVLISWMVTQMMKEISYSSAEEIVKSSTKDVRNGKRSWYLNNAERKSSKDIQSFKILGYHRLISLTKDRCTTKEGDH